MLSSGKPTKLFNLAKAAPIVMEPAEHRRKLVEELQPSNVALFDRFLFLAGHAMNYARCKQAAQV